MTAERDNRPVLTVDCNCLLCVLGQLLRQHDAAAFRGLTDEVVRVRASCFM